MNTNTHKNISANIQPISEIKKETKGIHKIEKLYSDITYFSEYGFSVIIFSFLTLLLLLGCAFCYVMIRAQSIKADWPNQRCHPYVIPFAGFINKPNNMTMEEYTQQNFDFCSQTILGSGVGESLQPLTFVTNIMSSIAKGIQKSIQDIRAVFNNVRTDIQSMASETMGRLLNMMIPLQQMFIDFKDIIAKIEGTLTATIYSSIGAYYTFQSLMGAIVNSIITILIAMAALIITLWLVPFTWPVATSMSAIFISISIPLALILAFMTQVLHVKANNPIPGLPSKPQCFDENTMIEMNDGSLKPISEIKIGEILKNNNVVTATLILKKTTAVMYELNGVIVSDYHLVFHRQGEGWIYVTNHPDAKKVSFYESSHLYCLNTSQKVIEIKNMLFLDWDEIANLKHETQIEKCLKKRGINPISQNVKQNIHRYLEGGLSGDTILPLWNGNTKEIRSLKMGDLLKGGEKVIGLVEIDGTTIEQQYSYFIFKNSVEKEKLLLKGGSNHIFSKNKDEIVSTLDLPLNQKVVLESMDQQLIWIEKREKKEKERVLYHLITDKQVFLLDEIQFYDYNAGVDYILG
jgi:hypothetical protein